MRTSLPSSYPNWPQTCGESTWATSDCTRKASIALINFTVGHGFRSTINLIAGETPGWAWTRVPGPNGMPNGTENFRNFQIFGKKDNLERLSGIFETNFSKYPVPFDSVPEFPEILA